MAPGDKLKPFDHPRGFVKTETCFVIIVYTRMGSRRGLCDAGRGQRAKWETGDLNSAHRFESRADANAVFARAKAVKDAPKALIFEKTITNTIAYKPVKAKGDVVSQLAALHGSSA